MASDYARVFADRRAIRLPDAPAKLRDPFAGLKLKTRRLDRPERISLDRAVERVARAVADIMRMREQCYDALPHQRLALERAAGGLNALRPDGSRDLRAAFEKDRALIGETAKGQTRDTIRAMVIEAEMRRHLPGAPTGSSPTDGGTGSAIWCMTAWAKSVRRTVSGAPWPARRRASTRSPA